MSHSDFVHLRVQTAYSLSEGAIHVKDLINQCVGHKMPAVAMTDNDNMFAALEFSTYAADAGIQPIVGVTLSVRAPFDEGRRSTKQVSGSTNQLVLIAQSDTGYRNLMKLVSKAHLDSDAQEGVQLPLQALKGHTEGVICLTGGPGGPVGQLILAGQMDKAELVLEGFKSTV